MKLGAPKLASKATESLLVHILNGKLLATELPEVRFATLARGAGPEPDLWLTVDDTRRRWTCEAKATGGSSWSRSSNRDAQADLFVWLNCGPLCTGAGDVHVWVLREPHKHLWAGMDWRSEREFRQRTRGTAMRVILPLATIIGSGDSAA